MAASTTATMKRIIVLLACLTTLNNVVSAFSSSPHLHNTISNNLPQTFIKSTTQLQALSDEEEQELRRVEEESRLKILTDRRKTIRGILKAAEGTKNYRLQNGYVPAINEETGKPEKSDAQTAVTITAFVVAAGAVALRIGGRAALVSALGLDFATENPELRDGGVVLALASGVLFGGVWQGAVVSAFSATVGSSVAFGMAKLDTPVRTKALEVVEEYPSLRGIEKVVAKDGLKAILTLRLAPVLPIPIGLYNYVGVTNVPYLDFAGGIFLGSLKPYLLDSYLGVFGKQLVDGTAGESGMQDALLLIALGVSVLIGVFASQLANETWESINEEVELEKKAAAEKEDTAGDGVMRQIMGMDLPQWIIGFQLSLQAADERVGGMIVEEYNANVWNYTLEELELDPIINPAAQSYSPEVANANKGFDFPASICDGLVLSPNLLSAYFRYADPLYNEEEQTINSMKQGTESLVDEEASAMKIDAATVTVPLQVQQMQEVPLIVADDLLKALEKLQTTLQKQLADL
eukprot:scaffold21052_cov101-Skeletonema_marinoi.AAC.3